MDMQCVGHMYVHVHTDKFSMEHTSVGLAAGIVDLLSLLLPENCTSHYVSTLDKKAWWKIGSYVHVAL